MRPIYLCGFMGCGKSHIGRLLSSELCAVFIDLDRYIVTQKRMSIPEIFEKYGEDYFRELEAKYIREFKGRTVIATGGGAILRDETARFARKKGVVIFIDVPFGTCYSRIAGDTNRPLVVNNTKEQLKALYDKRYPIYKANSGFTVTGNKSDTEIAREIIKISELDTKQQKGRI